jgi:glycosyltransferase involved in cell wall biosynthesis
MQDINSGIDSAFVKTGSASDASPASIVPGARVSASIVVPCYNEQEVLPETIKRLRSLLDRLANEGKVTADSEIIFVDDGSHDETWSIVRDANANDKRIRGIKLSANRGHQTALLAGLFTASGDAVVSVDADLQDDLAAIGTMLEAFGRGRDVVYGVRGLRKSDTNFKRGTAGFYYKLLAAFGVRIVHNHADFRLLSRRALEALKQYSEVNLFIRGIVPLIGFPSETVYYERTARFAGVSKYPLRKMLALAADGITSFTALPLRLIAMLGIAVSLLSGVMVAWVLWIKLFSDRAVPGWASSVIPIYFLGGIQLLSIGVLGEYVAKLYFEAKRRPRYFIEEQL